MMTICGPTQSGKTHKIVEIIDNIDDVIQPTPDKLLYLYTAEQASYDKIKEIICDKATTSALKTCEFIDCTKGIPTIADIKPKLGDATLMVLDDLMVLAMTTKENADNLNNLASRDSHHLNISVMFVCQNLNYGSGKLRNVRINCMYHLVFNNHTDTRDIELIARNKGIRLPTLRKILTHVGKKQYGYVLFDGYAHSPANTRVRTGILPGDCTKIYDVDKEFV
jgi:hypothetical protein